MAHVVTSDAGSHEITRVYYDYPVIGGGRGPERVFELGHGHNRVAGRVIERVVISRESLTVHLSGGMRVEIPRVNANLTYTLEPGTP